MVWLLSGESWYQYWRPICWNCLYDAWQKVKKAAGDLDVWEYCTHRIAGRQLEIHRDGEWGEIWPFRLQEFQDPDVCLLVLSACDTVIQYTSGTVYVLLINTGIVNNCCPSGVESKVPSQHQCRFSLSTLRFSSVLKITSPSSSMLTNSSPRVVSLFNKSSPSVGNLFRRTILARWSLRGKAAAAERGKFWMQWLITELFVSSIVEALSLMATTVFTAATRAASGGWLWFDGALVISVQAMSVAILPRQRSRCSQRQ